jgi:hypothetical protein
MSDFEVADRLRGVERAVEQSKNILIGLERSERRRKNLNLGTAIIRSLVCRLKARTAFGETPEAIA